MKICFTLDDVIRAKTRQFGKILAKSRGLEEDAYSNTEITTNNLGKVFEFESTTDYQEFLYKDYPFEVFAEAPVMERMLDKRFNLWTLDIENKEGCEDIEFMLANPFEFNASIGYTCFFLSQIATRIREFYFPKNSSDIWNKCDVLVTADPKLLAEKPEGKKSVKIEAPYNKDSEADLTYESLSKLIEDEEFTEKLRDNA
jgi:hypothetical protein